MTLNLRAAQDPGIATANVTAALSLCNVEAVAMMILSPWLMRLEPRPRWAAGVSFCLLSMGHLVLGAIPPAQGVLFSAVLLGAGEATSCGLRGVVRNSHRDVFKMRLGPQRARELNQLHENLTLLCVFSINASVPLLGEYFSMARVSVGLGIVGCAAAIYGALGMPLVPDSS
jgi:hypothetical protein